MKLKDINKNRQAIMGVAILLIVIIHLLITNEPIWCANIHRVCQNGVDIFLFLSGIGCYYSCTKNSTVKFYLHRIIRIIPPYLVVMITYGVVYCLNTGTSFSDFYWTNSILSFFVNGGFKVWFVGAILVLYAVTPLLYRFLNSSPVLYWITFGAIIIGTSQLFYLTLSDTIWNLNEFFFVRIPIYMLGLGIGKYIKNNEEKEFKFSGLFYFITLGSVALFFLNSFLNHTSNMMGITHYISIILAPIIVLWLTKLFNKYDCPVLTDIGDASFEIYLTNEKILIALGLLGFTNNYIIDIVGFIITLCISFLLRKITNFKEVFKYA